MTTYPKEQRENVAAVSPPSPASPKIEGKTTPQVVVVRNPRDLAQYATAWEELALAACEANLFYEPWMLLPAIEAFGDGHDFEFYLVFAAGRGPESPQPALNGIFPMERHKRYKGIPVQVLTLWRHMYCLLCTPLVRKGYEAETLHALLDYCATASRSAPLLEWNYLSGEGAFNHALIEVFNQRHTLTFVDEIWTRALLRVKPNTSGDDYIRGALSGKRRKEFKRQENRLCEEGDLKVVTLEPFDNSGEYDPYTAFDLWLEEFLQLEASGWKGEEGSAFACNPSHQQFFMTVTKEAYKRHRLDMLALQLDGRSLATKCNFLAGDGAFAFKIAYDEEYARYSPGVLLELEGITRTYANPRIHWMDSCAVQDHSMINRLWTERRMLQNIVIGTGKRPGDFVVSALPLLRWFKRKVRRTTHSNVQTASPMTEN